MLSISGYNYLCFIRKIQLLPVYCQFPDKFFASGVGLAVYGKTPQLRRILPIPSSKMKWNY
ncbi:MAG: hypothetical protein IPI59_04645 [Sphingobacteriales bacterium]|nr:hypothetical protein [Sphingobacteriales bacterium]MBK7526839.1 hypothetical protein [Sphingobacteriales bacterium]MBK8677333.1 hypothetical protein [Sphingobacteriales bacterium]MBP9142554.1 hypothetical protein [Chitinophagales bacterium]HMS53453.1 hypothetical protein [Chitinophagales bacterium]